MLHPPRGYRLLAWLGLIANAIAIPVVLGVMVSDPTWRAANIAVGLSGVLPAAIVGLVACIALLQWRAWGQVLAIIALSLSLAVGLPYGIVRLVMVSEGRPLLAVLAPLFWMLNVAALIYWCRPAHRHYLV
jgi:hypothetical protein